MKKEKHYWDKEYKSKKWVYGMETTILAFNVVNTFRSFGPKKTLNLLDLGGGYGRDAIFYAKQGFHATCLDISEIAIQQGKELAELTQTKVNFIQGNFLKIDLPKALFDVIVSYRFLYLFSGNDLQRILSKMNCLLKKGGITAHIVLSKDDFTYGKGKKIGENAYSVAEGKTVRYFEQEELKEYFRDFKVLLLKMLHTRESHGTPHIHRDWFILAQKE